MAIILDHTSDGNIALKAQNLNSTQVFNGIQENNELLISGSSINSISGLQSEINLKEDLINLGDVHDQNTGILAGNIVVVEQFQDNSITINPSLISSYAIKDTFTINNTGQLITLSNSDIGDVAIDIVNNNNYILFSSGTGAYLNINNWIPFTGFGEGVLYVNGHAPDGLGNVDVDSNEVYYCKQNLITISDKISETNVVTTGILQNYQKCNLFLNETGKYTLTSVFDNIASIKISEYHEHDITGVSTLSGRLSSLKRLCSGGNYNYSISAENIFEKCNSFIFSHHGISEYDSEIVFPAYDFNGTLSGSTGIEQVSKILVNGTSNSCGITSLFNFTIEPKALISLKADVVAKSKSDSSVIGSFSINSNFARNDSSLVTQLNESIINIYSQKNNLIADFCVNNFTGYSLYVSGENSSEINWLANVNIMKVISDYNGWVGYSLDPDIPTN